MSVGGVGHQLDSGEQSLTHVVATVTAAGSTTLYTPQPGNKILLRWTYALANPNAGVSPLISVFLGAQEKFRVYGMSKRQFVEGPVDGALSVSLDQAAQVAVTALLQEVAG